MVYSLVNNFNILTLPFDAFNFQIHFQIYWNPLPKKNWQRSIFVLAKIDIYVNLALQRQLVDHMNLNLDKIIVIL